MSTVTDMLNQPVTIGTRIAYSGPAGTGSSCLYIARIEEFIQIIPHPNGEPGHFVREDQLGKSRPTRFHKAGAVIKVRIETGNYNEGRAHSLTPGQARNFVKVGPAYGENDA